MADGASDVTGLLDRIRSGDGTASDALFGLVYGELRGLAGAIFRSPDPAHTLQPTALVHEAWMKMDGRLGAVAGREHFFAVAALAMRQVLTDHARAVRAAKRGGGATPITLHGDPAGAGRHDLVELDDALSRLGALNERHAEVASFRLFGGMTIPEIAQHLGVSPRTVDADWSMARAWLGRELYGVG